jgi:hypothetical protein
MSENPDQDEMRRKRLARLAKLSGGGQPTVTSPTTEVKSPEGAASASMGEPSKTDKVCIIMIIIYEINRKYSIKLLRWLC